MKPFALWSPHVTTLYGTQFLSFDATSINIRIQISRLFHLSRAQTMDVCLTKSKTLFPPRPRIFVRIIRRRQTIVRPVFCSHDIGTGDDWLHVQNVSWFCWVHPQTADKCFWLRTVLLFTWHRHRRWLATRAKCFGILLGSPAEAGKYFLSADYCPKY
jgi:hypothetical protein